MPQSGETAALLVEERGPLRLFTLSNPTKRNALDGAVLLRLREELARARRDGVRCLVLRGEGERAFSAGYDLTSLAAAPETGPLPDALLVETLADLRRPGPPVVAFLNGPAFGAGCELACACDFRIASETASLGMPPARLGIIYAPAGIARVSALIGPSRARRMFFTGEAVDAPTALAWGLVDELGGLNQALALAEAIAAGAPGAVQGMRRVFEALEAVRLDAGEAGALEEARRAAFRSEDAKEGRAAFLEKRTPRFSGR